MSLYLEKLQEREVSGFIREATLSGSSVMAQLHRDTRGLRLDLARFDRATWLRLRKVLDTPEATKPQRRL